MGICTVCLTPPWGFRKCLNARPHRGAFAAFPNQNDKCIFNDGQMPGGIWGEVGGGGGGGWGLGMGTPEP